MNRDRIIIVEDNVAVLRHLEQNIDWANKGIEVVGTYTNGCEAIGALSDDLAVVITDIVMPRCSGVDVIRAIAERGYDTESIVISAYDEFDYVRDALTAGATEYLLKPVDEASLLEKVAFAIDARRERIASRRRVDELAPLVADELLRAVVTGAEWGRAIEPDSSFAGLSLKDRYGICMIVELEADPRFGEPGQRREYHARYLLARATCERTLSALDARVIPITDRRLCALVQCLPSQVESIERRLPEHTEILSKSVQHATGFGVITAQGEPAYSWQTYHESYRQALNKLRTAFLGTTSCPPVRPMASYPAGLENRLLAALREQREKDALAAARELCDAVSSSRLAAAPAKTVATAVLTRLVLDVSDDSKVQEDRLSELVRELETATTLEQLRTAVSRIARSELARRTEMSQRANQALVEKIRAIVRERYADPDLTVETIAADVFLTANYVSRRFKVSTGQNLRDHLVDIRIEEAKKLLRFSPFRVYEIAERVGFRNAQYFATRFRERVGMSPLEYARVPAQSVVFAPATEHTRPGKQRARPTKSTE